jgi:hypothetical protein
MAGRDKGITEAEKDQQRKLETLNTNLEKASGKLNGTFANLVANVAETNREYALELAEKRLETRATFSGFLARSKLAAHTREFLADNADSEKERAELKAKLLNDEKLEINRNKSLNAMKDKVFSKQFSIDNNITMGIEDRLKKQTEIDAIQQEVDAKESEIKKFRAKQFAKISKEEEQAQEDYTKMLNEASKSEDFDKFSGSVKNLTGGLLDIGGMLDDVVKFGEDLQNVAKGIQSAFGKISELSNKLGNFIGDSLKSFASEIGNFFKAGYAKLEDLPIVGGAFTKLKDIVMSLIGSIGALWLTMKTKMKDLVSGIKTKVKDGTSKVGEKFKSAKESITSKVGEKFQPVKDVFSEKAKLFQGKMSDLGNTMKNGAKTMGGKGLKAIKMAPKMLMKGATRFVSLLARIPAMLAAIPALLASPFVLIGAAVLLLAIGLVLVWMKFKDQIMEKFEMMKTKVTEVVTNIVDGFLDVWQRVKNWFSDKVFGIRSFLGLTSEEEEAEHAKQEVIKEKEKEKERLKEEQKEIAMQAKEAEIDAQLKAEFGEDALNWGWGRGDSDAKDMKKQMMEQAEADIDQDMAMDDISSKDLLKERNQSEDDYDNVQNVIDARQKEVENKVKFSNLKINGEDATEEQKREYFQEQADKGQLDGRLGGGLERFEGTKGVTTQELREEQAAEVLDINRAQKELDTREDYIPMNRGDNATIARRNELQGIQSDDEVFGDGEGLTEKEKMELTRLERDQGDRIKDSADRAKEMGPKRPDPSINTSVAQQNTNNNVTNNTISASPNPRPTDRTINRTATVNQN